MTVSNRMQLGLGAAAAVVLAVCIVVFVGPATKPAPIVSLTPRSTEAPSAVVVPVAPTLDTVRVDPDGATVMAGRAAPFAVVDIMLDGVKIDQIYADASGVFAGFAQLGFSDVARAITLVADGQGIAVTSGETYLIAPVPQPAVVADESDPAAPTPAVIVAATDGVRVIQPSLRDASPQGLSSVALDSITYNPSGDLQIAGRASGVGTVQVYIDNQPITSSRITVNGDWQVDLPDVDTGIYTLRIDELGDDGDVVSRIETPFQREEPEVVAQAIAAQTQVDAFQVAMTTVQPGTTLWAIAQERFGSGILYVKVFEANRDRIRDPDLIYPGQVFRIPPRAQ